MLEVGEDFLKIEKKGDNDISVVFNKEQVFTKGQEAIGKFLLKLNTFKATADFDRAKEMFSNYSQVSDEFLEIRKIVINNKKPRRLEVQGHLKEENGEIQYEAFSEDFSGIIKSYFTRYPEFDLDMLENFNQYAGFMRPPVPGEEEEDEE